MILAQETYKAPCVKFLPSGVGDLVCNVIRVQRE